MENSKDLGGIKSRELAAKYGRRLRAVYFLLLVGFIITAGSRRALAPFLPEDIRDLFKWAIYFVFEHYFRFIVIALGAYYSIRRTLALKGTISKFRLLSLLSFVVATAVFLTIIPSIFGFSGTRFMGFTYLVMPFTWLSSILQVGLTGEVYRQSFTNEFGPSGIKIAVITYLGFQVYVFVPTLFYGRRWYCSMTCLFMGGHAETIGDALPLITPNKKRPKSKAVGPKTLIFLRAVLVMEIATTLFVYAGLITWLVKGSFFMSAEWLIKIELLRYVIFDNFMVNLFMWTIGGRFYCYFCVPGFLLGAIGRGVGQRIETDLGECNGCDLCSDACKMSLKVGAAAIEKTPMKSVFCVGCGLCVDACKKSNLRYSTAFTRKRLS